MRFAPTRLLLPLAALLLSIALLLHLPSCTSEGAFQRQREQVTAERDKAAAAVPLAADAIAITNDKLAAERAKVAALQEQVDAGEQAHAAELAATTAKVEAIAKQLAELERAKAAAEATAAELTSRLADAERATKPTSEPNPGQVLGTTIGAFIPGAGAVLPIILAMGYRLVNRELAARRLAGEVDQQGGALNRIVKSIDTLAEVAPEVALAFEKHKATIDAIQDPIGKAYVDKAQGRGTTVLAA